MERLRFRIPDLIPVALVAALAAAVFCLFLPGQTRGSYVEIYQGGRLLQVLPLSEDRVFVIEGAYENTVTVKDGKVAVTQSDCPGGDCMRFGFRDTAGSIVCLPNGVELRIVGDTGVDAVVG